MGRGNREGCPNGYMDNSATTLPARIKSRVTDAFAPRRSVDAQNAWNLYQDIFWFGVLFAVWQSFLSIYTIRLGGTDTHVGLLSALPALAAIFASIPGSRMVEREKKPLSVMLVTGTLHRVGFLALGLVPSLFVTNRADWAVALFCLATIPQSVANVAFTTMFARAVKPEDRPRVVSNRNVLIGVSSTATALLGGKFLDLVIFPTNYQLLFALAFLTSLLSIYYLARIRLPAPARAPLPSAQESRGARGFIAMLRAQPAYMRFTFGAFIVHLALFFAIPLYSIYWVRVLHATEGWVGLLMMVQSATSIFAYPIWGRLSTQYGNRTILVVASLGLGMYPFFTALAPSVEWLLPIAFWGGALSPGLVIALFNGLLEVCPEERRASFIAVYNTAINIAAFIAPVVSSSLTSVVGVQALLFVAAGVRLLGGVSLGQGKQVAGGR